MLIKCPGCSLKIEVLNQSGQEIIVTCEHCGKKLKIKTKKKSDSAKRILVADDTVFFRTMLKDILEDNGYEVLTAGDGEEALKVIKHELPNLHLVLLDMLMPKITGFDVLKETRKGAMGKNLKMLAMTGVYSNDKDIAYLRECGADGYIKKSNDMDDILFRVKQALSQEE